MHGEEKAAALALMKEVRERKSEAKKKVEESLEGWQQLRTRSDYLFAMEKVVNGVLQGVIKRDIGMTMGLLLPQGFKMAKELEGSVAASHSSVTINVDQDGSKSLILSMSPDQMDRYLASSEHVRIEMLEELEHKGKVKISQKKHEQTIDVTNVKPEDVTTDVAGIVEMTKLSGTPLDKKQVVQLFGKNLRGDEASAKIIQPIPEPDLTGFDDLYDDRKMPPETNHTWESHYADMGDGMAIQTFKCTKCGATSNTKTRNFCEASIQ